MAQTASPADITAVSDLLKEVYTSDTIQSQLYDDALLLSQIESTHDYHDSVGSKAIGFVKTGRNVGVSARSLNGGTLGAAGHQQHDRWELDYTANYVQVKILGTTIAKMKTARQAAVREIDHEITGAIQDLKKDLQRQLYGNGDALIVQCGTTTASTTVVLNTTNPKESNDVLVRDWLQVGEYIDIGTTASEGSVASERTITAITPSDTAPTITISGAAVTTSSSNYISRSANRSGTTSYELNGLRNLVAASGTFAAIDGTTAVPQWRSTVIDASSAALSRPLMQQAFRETRRYAKPDLIITSLEQQEAYYNTLQAQVRFAGDSNLASGTVDGPVFNKIPVSADPDCQRQDVYFLSKSNLFMVSAGDIEWQNVNTGGDKLAWVQGEDAFVARAAFYANFGTNLRRAHARIKGLSS